MAKRQEGLSFDVTIPGCKRDDLWKIAEGAWGLGKRRVIIDMPPAEVEPIQVAVNGAASLPLLTAPKRRQTQKGTGREIMLRLAAKGGPFSFSDLKRSIEAAGKKLGAGGILKQGVKQGEIKRIGTGMYVAATAPAADAVKAAEPSSRTTASIVEEMLQAAYPKPLASSAVRDHLTSIGRRPSTGSVAINHMKKKRLAKRVGNGLWVYTPPRKGAKK